MDRVAKHALTLGILFQTLECFGAFAVDETATPNVPAVTICNINTGVATGLDAGTCARPVATCNGVSNDAPAFQAFNRWAKSTRANANGQLIELQVSGTCMFLTGGVVANSFLGGIKKSRLMGYGATLSNNNQLNGFWLGGLGLCAKGLSDPGGCSARMASVNAGASSVRLLDISLCSRFVVGRWALVAGFDLQGIHNIPYGKPPNAHYLDFVQITSTANCASTGEIALGSALTYDYLETWPLYSAGNSAEPDQGGPATIYAFDPTWDIDADIRGITIDQQRVAVNAPGRSVTFRDVTVLGSLCVLPSENAQMLMINATMTNCDIETDKIIGLYSITNSTALRIKFQSSSTNTFNLSGSTIQSVLGTPKVATITNSVIGSLNLGPYAYGVPISASCTDCRIGNTMSAAGLLEKGDGDPGANLFYTVAGGVFSFPASVTVTGFADNGSGKVRLTVGSTTGWTTSNAYLSRVFSSGGNNGGPQPITVVDGTHIDLAQNFSRAVWSGAGTINNSALGSRWAAPGTNVFPSGPQAAATPAFQVTSVTKDSNGVHIATTLSGGYPAVPLDDGKSYLRVQLPKWTCTNCSGTAQAVDFSGAPPNIPFASYSNRTWRNSTPLEGYPLWGKVTSIKINVTQPYTGSTNPLRFNFFEQTVVPGGTGANWDALINLRQAGLRTITPLGVTCDTGGGPVTGGCKGDSGLALPNSAAMFAANLSPMMNDGTPTDQTWTMSAEFVVDQGVVP